MRILNLISTCAAIQAALHPLAAQVPASSPDAPDFAAILARIRAHASHVEAICARSGSNPAALPTPSRRAYQWLKYLSAPANLLAQLATMSEARRVIAQMAWLKEGELARYTITFELSYGSYLYHTAVSNAEGIRRAGERPPAERDLPRRTAGGVVSNAGDIRPAGESIRISVAQGFNGAPPDILEALIKASLSRRQRKARAAVMAYAAGEDYAETSMAFELAADLPQADVRGRHHDLAQSFARVNAEYFGGRLTPPRLTWSCCALVSDVTQVKQSESAALQMVVTDKLTGLSNRLGFERYLPEAIQNKSAESLALMLVDIKGFKQINASMGIAAGDLMLQIAALRLRGCLKKTDWLARLDGDEFSVVLHGVTTQARTQHSQRCAVRQVSQSPCRTHKPVAEPCKRMRARAMPLLNSRSRIVRHLRQEFPY